MTVPEMPPGSHARVSQPPGASTAGTGLAPDDGRDDGATAHPAVAPVGPVTAGPRSFRHLHAAHCESGVTSALLGHSGLSISEPMVFGIGSGILFLHAPFFKVMGVPLTSYRSWPLSIFRKACRRLDVAWSSERFWSQARGARALDAHLAAGRPVGLQANMFWLSYFPPQFRFQFNGHNLIAVERATGGAGGEYLLSDPVLETMVRCPPEALARARFAKGPLAPRGLLYYPVRVPETPDLRAAVRAGIKESCRVMLRTPVPIVGVRGIRFLARRVPEWPRRLGDDRRVRLWLGNIVRMQEEVGTGGAGFRFMYAAFLQEAGERIGHPPFERASTMMTEAGDLWRDFAEAAALVVKDRAEGKTSLQAMSAMLLEIARREEEVFGFLDANLPRA